ncbi:MAG: SCO family protein [Myxococcales bacterium]|nr:SCO family protein [Myxococcales bacterium]
MSNPAPAPSELLDAVDIEQHLNEPLPMDLELRSSDGATVRLGDVIGPKPTVLALVYYECPMLCTMVLNGLLRSINTIDDLDVGKDFDIVAVSIDPDEGPALAAEKLGVYRSKYRREGSSTGWHFLTGDQAAIDRLADAVGFRYVYDEESDQYAHGSSIMVVTPEGRLSKYLMGIDYDPRSLRLALVEASAGRIGTAVDRIILYCFQYDPTSGTYSLAILRILRTLAALMVIGLGAFMVSSHLKDRRRANAASS